MVYGEVLVFENQYCDYGEYRQRDELLDDLKLPQIKRAAVVNVADAVGRHHETVFQQRNAPAEQHHHWQGEFTEPSRML